MKVTTGYHCKYSETSGPLGSDIQSGLLLPALIGLEMDLVHAIVDGTGFVVEVSNVVTVTIGA